MTRILIICEFGCEAKNSTGHLVSQIPDLLDGADVEIIDTTAMPWLFRRLYKTLEQLSTAGLLSKFIAVLGLLCAYVGRKGDYDQIIVVSNPFFTLLLPPLLWRIKAKRLNYLIFDLFPETLKATKMSVPIWAYKTIKMLRNRNLRRANCTFVIGRDMKKHLISQNVGASVIYVPLWIGATEAMLPVTSQITKEESPDEIIRLNFFGHIGQVQNFNDVFRLLESNTTLSLDVFGAGSKLKFIARESNSRVHFFGAVPFQDRARIFELDGIGLVPQQNSLVGLAVPSKAFYYWSRGLPVLFMGAWESEIGQIILRAPELGLVLPPGSKLTDYALKLQAMKENVNHQQVMSRCGDLRYEAQSTFLRSLEIQL